MSLWYLPLNSISGAASEFPIGNFLQKGGKIVAIIPWTIDSGHGSDDLFCILSSEGEIAVYSGTDPASLTTWDKNNDDFESFNVRQYS